MPINQAYIDYKNKENIAKLHNELYSASEALGYSGANSLEYKSSEWRGVDNIDDVLSINSDISGVMSRSDELYFAKSKFMFSNHLIDQLIDEVKQTFSDIQEYSYDLTDIEKLHDRFKKFSHNKRQEYSTICNQKDQFGKYLLSGDNEDSKPLSEQGIYEGGSGALSFMFGEETISLNINGGSSTIQLVFKSLDKLSKVTSIKEVVKINENFHKVYDTLVIVKEDIERKIKRIEEMSKNAEREILALKQAHKSIASIPEPQKYIESQNKQKQITDMYTIISESVKNKQNARISIRS